MIVWFRFQNYGSFWHNTLISMQSGIYREHPEHLVPGPKGSLLKTLAIYGPNSSGKSQLINALAFYAAFVRRQLPFPLTVCGTFQALAACPDCHTAAVRTETMQAAVPFP